MCRQPVRLGSGTMIAALILALLAPAAAAQDTAEDAPVADCLVAAPDPEARRACIGAVSEPCLATDQTTYRIASCFEAELVVWDRLLNARYTDLLDTVAGLAPPGDTSGSAVSPQDDLRTAQRAWIAFRDADCRQEVNLWSDGSIARMIGPECLMRHTALRTLDLTAKAEALAGR